MSDQMQIRIGILGGTFNPIHVGHLMLAQGATERCDLAKVLFIPCAVPPHKKGPLSSAEHRLAMIKAAIEGDLRFEACDMDIRRGGVSYAIDTLRELHREYPETELCFLLGSDSLPELHLWKDVYSLLKLCSFKVFARPGLSPNPIKPERLALAAPWPERLLRDVMNPPMADVSSSDIRHRVAEGLSIRYLVPQAVEMYIAEHGLYL